MSQRDVERFSRWGSNYDEHWLQPRFFDPVQKATLDRAALLVPHPRRLLDVGCGTGALLRQARARVPEVDLAGIDPAHGMVSTAHARWNAGRPAAFLNAAVERLPFVDESFDLVVSTISFHHWHDQKAGLTEIRRVLAPGGALVLTDIVAVSWLRLVFSIGRTRSRFHTPREIEEMIRRAQLLPAGIVTAFPSRGIPAVSSFWSFRL